MPFVDGMAGWFWLVGCVVVFGLLLFDDMILTWSGFVVVGFDFS